MQKAGLFGHIQRCSREIIVLTAMYKHVGLDRVCFARFHAAARFAPQRKMRVLDDAVRFEVLLRDLRLTAQLGHEAKGDSRGD